MILILDDILNSNECNNLIEIYQKNKQYSHTHGNPTFYPLNIKNILDEKNIALEVAKRIEQITNKYYNSNIIDWYEIVKWPCNTWQSYHLDTASKETSLTSITYLNENFDGGRSVMYDGTKIKPKTGRTLIFDGNKYIHGVEPILKGERYTLPIWYKNTVRELI